MNPPVLASGLVLLGYLIGAIPTAYLLVKARTGQDIRALGSGNVGATNAGRALGRWAFWVVFVVDLLKGLVPTALLPALATDHAGMSEATLRVLVGVATILGHNFPVYLGFRGGKGVATSLGAVLAIDPVAAGVAALVFGLGLAVTRIVSISSIVGAFAFSITHFARTARPWDPGHWPTSVALLALLGLILFRHRANLKRLMAGTEPKIGTRASAGSPPRGFVRLGLAAGLTVLSLLGVWGGGRLLQPAVMECAGLRFQTLCRVQTGHQRAERLCFLDAGRQLAVACPRYDRVVLYHVTDVPALTLSRELRVEGKPVALAATRDHLIILQRPSGDARHLEPGFLQVYDFRTERLGPRVPVGYDPDDVAFVEDGRWALVLLSGRAEGEHNRPAPSVIALNLSDPDAPEIVDALTLDEASGDPWRLLPGADGRSATVLFNEGKSAGRVDFRAAGDLASTHPRLTTAEPQTDLSGSTRTGPPPELLDRASDWTSIEAMASRSASEIAPAETLTLLARRGGSVLELYGPDSGSPLGVLPLRGPFRLGQSQPMGVDWNSDRQLVAVADRTGGVHLIQVVPGSR